jgi:hypothetical protein
VGFVLVRSREYGAVVLGRDGARRLATDAVEGADPLTAYGPHAADLVRRVDGFPHCADIMINSRYEPGTDDAPPFTTPAAPGTGDVLVVGGGPAGLEAARAFALQGRIVHLMEGDDRLGGALRLAAALPGRERFGLLVDWWERELALLGVTVSTGRSATPADLDDARARGADVLLAEAAHPEAPGLPPALHRVLRGWLTHLGHPEPAAASDMTRPDPERTALSRN